MNVLDRKVTVKSGSNIMKMCRQIGYSKIRGTWVVRVKYYEDV